MPVTNVSRRSFLLGMAACLALSKRADATTLTVAPFSFAFVTDVHLANNMPDTYKLVHESQLFLQEAVKSLNQEKLDFIIFGGDQVETLGKNQENWQLFLDIVQGLNAPWSFILGEKDLNDVSIVDKMRTFGADWKARGIETNKPYWSHNPIKDVHIIGLDTSVPNFSIGDVSPWQMDWLKKDVEENKDKFTIVFSHHPILPPPPFDGGPPWDDYVLTQGSIIREILEKYPNIHLAVSGHVHTSKIQQEKHIWYVSSPSLDVYPCAYRVFKVSSDNITVETKQLNFPALVKKARKELVDSTMAYNYNNDKPVAFVDLIEGEQLDKNALLPYGTDSQPQSLHESKHKSIKEKPQQSSSAHSNTGSSK